MRATFLLVVCLTVAGCAIAPVPSRQGAPVEAAPPGPVVSVPVPAPAQTRAAPSPTPGSVTPLPKPGAAAPPRAPASANASSPAVLALLDQAKLQAQQGEGERAAATLERAIRIEPRNPWLWHRLGVLRLQQNRYRDAIDMANKSNALADGNRQLLSGNYRVIAEALGAAGDKDGAARARERSRYYGPSEKASN